MTTELVLTSSNQLRLQIGGESSDLLPKVAEGIGRAFEASTSEGLLHLATVELGTALPSSLAWWREFACLYINRLLCCAASSVHARHKYWRKRFELFDAILSIPKEAKIFSFPNFLPPPGLGADGGYHLSTPETSLEKIGGLPQDPDDHPPAMHEERADSPEPRQGGRPLAMFRIVDQEDLAAFLERAFAAPSSQDPKQEILEGCLEDLTGYLWKTCGWEFREWLCERNRLWRTVGRFVLHLGESQGGASSPFCFKLDYIAGLTGSGESAYLSEASPSLCFLTEKEFRDAVESAGASLSAFLKKVNRIADKRQHHKEWLAALLGQDQAVNGTIVLRTGESVSLGRVQPWSATQAYAFLQDVASFEDKGILVHVPDWWLRKRSRRLAMQVVVGEERKLRLGAGEILDFSIDLTLGGDKISREELESLQQASEQLVRFKGRWVEVDRAQISAMLERLKSLHEERHASGIPFLEALQSIAGYPNGSSLDLTDEGGQSGIRVRPGVWLSEILADLRDPIRIHDGDVTSGLQTTLRPYQKIGARWLWFMSRLGLGACLADDMGLGKTIEVLAFLLRHQGKSDVGNPDSAPLAASLLVVPASLIANWLGEIRRFTPTLRVVCLHPSETTSGELAGLAADPSSGLAAVDLVITSYGMVPRLHWLRGISWNSVILDEAQAIKNPGSQQAKSVKKLPTRVRIALTGTPVENRIADLWSLFDFLNPGLLGTARQFSRFIKSRRGRSSGELSDLVGPLRSLTRPYILRRVKTDKRIIDDLPDKIETHAFCTLSPSQIVLYRQAVKKLEKELESSEGIQRRGIILSTLMHLKQICNHPDQWRGQNSYRESESGKLQRLREISEAIADRGEKVLVFTQFRELCVPLATFLAGIFGRPGLVLHGGTQVRDRRSLVETFKLAGGPPFFVLSLKAGGVGLNLTEASHVVHFDRWWNPAVENQATDRAHRIGQRRVVLVHKLLCQGTVEERIDALIAEKRGLADDLLGGKTETMLTEMGTEELMQFVSLSIHSKH
jgi:non-specific serine/threonine protein kinase